mgnify:CR=1 FL=1
MLRLCITKQMLQHLPLVSGWSSTRPSFAIEGSGYAIENDSGGFGK